MRFFLKLLVIVVVIIGAGWAAYKPAMSYWKQRNRPTYRTDEVTRRTITSVVNTSGEVKPVLSVLVGSFVSGPIEELHADFNDHVEKDQLLAEIDPRIYEAAVQRDRATLITREADVERVRAQLQQAINDEKRSIALREENADFISKTEMDRFHFNRMSLDAQLKVAQATIAQAEANLENSEANLGYTKIRSPVNGIIIDRKIDPGQTLAAQFQAPELFIIAPEMDKKMHVFASVDEADIGLIRTAQEKENPVHFTVDAYPDDLFVGEIEQIRFSSTETQTVVTYPVIVAAPNEDLKLLPGMTANLSFQIDEKEDVLCVPNAALRFYPTVRRVREEDRSLLDGAGDDDDDSEDEPELSAREKADADRNRRSRHVWVEDGEWLRAVEVTTGISDNRFTEIESDDLEVGDKLVIGIKTK